MSHDSQTDSQVPDDAGAGLLAAFPATLYDEWRRAAEQSLKGVPFEHKLVTRTAEGITLQPMYWQRDIAALPHLDSLPGFPPYLRGAAVLGALTRPWDVAQTLPYADPLEWNRAATHDLHHGQTALTLALDRATSSGRDPDQAQPDDIGSGGLSLATVADLQAALKGINLEATPLFVQAGAAALPFAALLVALASGRGVDATKLHGAVESDPLGVLARTGALPCSLEQAYDELALLTAWVETHAPRLATIGVDSAPYHESGGSVVQELAFALATAVDYVRALEARGLAIETIAPRVRVCFSIGTHVFMEIARLRAARLLWARVVQAFGGGPELQRITVHVRGGRWNKTVHDPYVNMLRATIEAFAGAVGGCDSLEVGPFDELIRRPDEFGRRIARNTQLILRDESHVARVVDPAGGSYYVEALTDALAREAWARFQEIERHGGMAKALQAGVVQRAIAATAEQRDQNLATRSDVLVGTNLYPDPHEQPLTPRPLDRAAFAQERGRAIAALRAEQREGVAGALEQLQQATGAQRLHAAVQAAHGEATLGEITTAVRGGAAAMAIEPLHIYRAAEPFEQLRAVSEAFAARTGARPLAFLANMGPAAQHKARADFSAGFLEVAGIAVIGDRGFATADEAADAAIDSDAPIVVICSTDDTYGELVPPLARRIKAARPATRVLLAGFPKAQIEAYQAAGVDDFIHLRANAVEVLGRLLRDIGASA